MSDPDYGTMAKALIALRDEKKYAEFLRKQSLAGDHSFLLSAISRSNLRASIREVVEELITGKLRRPKHRPTSDDTVMKNVHRALRVLDIEAAGCNKRDAAIAEAESQLCCSYSAVEKALRKYEGILKGADAKFLDNVRAAFK